MENEIYRPCAAIVVLRPSNICSPDGCGTVYEYLLLHKPRKCDAWQLPQGGVESGETLEEAALRELKEEAGIEAEIVGKSSEVYQYDFPESFRSYRPDNVCGQRVEFVFAKLTEGQKVQVDEDEIDGHVWVLPEHVGKYIERKEYLAFVERLFVEGMQLLQK